MPDYKKAKTACSICSSCMITVRVSKLTPIYRCTEYNAERIIEESIERCSEFSLRRILRADITNKETLEVEAYFQRDLF